MPIRQAPLGITAAAGVPAAVAGDRLAVAGDLRVEIFTAGTVDRAAVAGVRLAEAGADIAGIALDTRAAAAGDRAADRLRRADARADT